jgi:hypothetical protein
MNRKQTLALVGAFVLVAIAYYLLGSSHTPSGQPPLVSLNQGNVTQFEQSFDARADSTRLVLLLSPT